MTLYFLACLFLGKVLCQHDADLKSCYEEYNQPKICLNNKENYKNPFPVTISIELVLREFVKIDEEDNLISIQMLMYSTWTDPQLASSNKTIK